MTTREFLENRRKAEYPTFMKVMKAMPTDRFDYRPHERSPSAAELVWTLAREMEACCLLIDEGRMNWTTQTPPADPEAIISAFQKHYEALSERISRIDESGWQSKVQLLIEGTPYRGGPVGEFLWYLFFDAIHHRGQLSTYIRPMGGQVPSIYGPSGDDPGG
uniref:DinB family protein n=1 Tax=Solibacter usitatus (strain Ellin6076) TaxID=234267 RepID=Q01Y08_SOLUE